MIVLNIYILINVLIMLYILLDKEGAESFRRPEFIVLVGLIGLPIVLYVVYKLLLILKTLYTEKGRLPSKEEFKKASKARF